MYLFIDTETTGLPKSWRAPVGQLDNWPRIVELGWILADKNGKELEAKTGILKPDGFSIPADAAAIHGITTEQANAEGVDRVEVFKQLATLLTQAQVLVAHNLEFDRKVVHSEFMRYSIKSNIHKIDNLCTKELTTDYCKLPGQYGFKWPTLGELYEKVYGTELLESHSAFGDVQACKDCFFELVDRGIIKQFGTKVLVDTLTDTDDDDLIEVDDIEDEINYNGDFQYFTRVRHLGLKEHKFLKASDEWVLEEKIERQRERFEAKWEKAKLKLQSDFYKQSNILEAEERTNEALELLKEVETILEQTILVNDAVNWNELKNNRPFKEQSPEQSLQSNLDSVTKPIAPTEKKVLRMPASTDTEFQPNYNFFENYFFKSLKEKKTEHFRQQYLQALENWKSEKARTEKQNESNQTKYNQEIDSYNKTLADIKAKNIQDIKEWEQRKEKYYQDQKEYNTKVDQLKENYFAKDPTSIAENCELALNNSKYPDYFPKTFELHYIKEKELLVVDYCLPTIDSFPRVKQVKFVKASADFKDTQISQTQLNSTYSDAIFQIAIRTVHELYEADVVNALKQICFNGFFEVDTKQFIISYQADKDTFSKLQLSGLDCKEAVKQFKGTFTAKWTEVKPILQLDDYKRKDSAIERK